MSGIEKLDRYPRMRDYMEAKDLNLEACVTLAATVLSEQANELAHAARRYMSSPNKDNRARLNTLRRFYETDWFAALSCGLADGKKVADDIIRDACGMKL